MTSHVLTSNGAAVPFDDETFAPMRDSSPRDAPAALRARLAEDGYLLLRGVLDPDRVAQLRAAYFATFPSGVLVAGTDPAAGVFDEAAMAQLPPYGVAGHPAYAFVRSRPFAEFVDQPALRRLATILLGGAPRRLPRVILRHFTRGTQRSSRAHTDHGYMDRGSDRVLTFWIPVGDCPLPMGGLVYLDRSHTLPRDRFAPLHAITDRPDDPRPISHDLAWVASSLGRRWRWADYRAGDLAIHGPHVVHAALDTTTAPARVSVDVRFALADDTADPRWLQPWAADDGA